jgi:hypothetical protein
MGLIMKLSRSTGVGIENVIMGEVVGMNGSFNIFCLETFGLG